MRRLLAVLLVLAGPASAGAWPADLTRSLVRDARRLLPASLARLVAEREERLLEEAKLFPPALLAADIGSGRLQPQTVEALQAQSETVVRLLREGQLTQGIVRLGGLLRVGADLSDPVLAAGPEGYPPGVTREYYAFVGAQLAKIPVAIDDPAALRLDRRRLPLYWQDVLDRSRRQSDIVRTELFRGGRVVDHRALDYRSPVFAVASLSYSRAVTAIAATWLAVWREAGGDPTRVPAPVHVQPQRN